MHIIGTAGHVDHGKSALVQALTGVNPDRWAEERERGMTLDLGFARLAFEDRTEAGIVDVPGHERFLHNMLAGAAGMELLLLVVAATEGVMPQTREHLAILRFLNVRRTIVVVTKADLLEPAALQNSIDAIERELRGTLAQDARVIAFSALTGAGLSALREQIYEAVRALPPRDANAPVYLPVDRVFALPGRGTIVTGTLMQGRIAVGDTLAVEPGAQTARVRSLHVFGDARSEAFGGTRVALNLPGIVRSSISRGAVVADAEFTPRSDFTVRFSPLSEALPLLRKRMPVRAHIGSAEVAGTLRLREVPSNENPVEAELVLKAPVVAFPGVRFVLRRMSPKTLLGGGEIAAISAAEAAGDERSALERTIAEVLAGAELDPADVAAVAFRANVREDVAQTTLEALVARGEAVRIARPDAYLEAAALEQFAKHLFALLQDLHEEEPWTTGATSLQLSRTLAIAEPLLVRILLALVNDGRIVQRSGYFAMPDHEPRLSASQRAFFDEIVASDSEHPFLPASFAEAAAAVKASPIPGANKAFDMLLARGALVRVEDALYRGSQISNIHAKLESFIDSHGRMTMAEFRDVIGTSRKYAVPLLEWFDSRGYTVRSGDFRMLRARKGERARPV